MVKPRGGRGVLPCALLLGALALPAPTADAAGCAHAGAQPSKLSSAAARAAVLCSVNQVRARQGLPAFKPDRRLRRAATGHARDMVRHRYFAHQRPGGPSFPDRLASAGWRGSSAGEAIAYGCGGYAPARATVRAWLNSPPHRAILLSRTFRRAGFGIAARPPLACGAAGATWVLDAGRR
jgi:uncharacterized protein YkwD